MQFYRINTLGQGVEPLLMRLRRDLADGKKVLWLLSGGSLVQPTVSVMNQLDNELTANLTLMLMDERFGDVGHADSNDHKLGIAGLDPKQGTWVRVLEPELDIKETCRSFAEKYGQVSGDADVVLGLFGMGSNGHIAGIQPGSPAVTSADTAAAYEWDDFRRITLTPKALMSVTAAYLVAGGTDKRQQLERLRDQDVPLAEQPAQLLKQLPEACVYNDQIGEEI